MKMRKTKSLFIATIMFILGLGFGIGIMTLVHGKQPDIPPHTDIEYEELQKKYLSLQTEHLQLGQNYQQLQGIYMQLVNDLAEMLAEDD